MPGPLPTSSLDDLVTVGYRWALRDCLGAAGWFVARTMLPSWSVEIVALVFLVVVTVATGALLEAVGVDLGGRCRARTRDGSRCSHPRRPGEGCCRQVHQRVGDIELVDEDSDG
jgi:hypothetical protein